MWLSLYSSLWKSLMRLAGGQADPIRHLCDLACQNHKVVEHNTIRSLEGRRFELRGEAFSAEFLTGSVTRFCPAWPKMKAAPAVPTHGPTHGGGAAGVAAGSGQDLPAPSAAAHGAAA